MPPLLGLPYPSEYYWQCASTLLAWILPLRSLEFPLRPLGFSPHCRPRSLSRTVHPPMGLGPPSEYYGSNPLSRPRLDSSFHEVSCLIAPSVPQVGFPRRAPHRRRLPSPGFLNLPTAFTLCHLAGLFHPAGTSRLFPPGPSLLKEPHCLSAIRAFLSLSSALLSREEAKR
jgi:hypothetical protein